MTFNQDNTCIITIAGKTQQANYTYDQNAHTLRITGQVIGLSFGTAYATISSTQMSLTLDSSKLLDVAKNVSSKSQNSTVNAISSIASAFNGMKTGFKFVRK
jgi:phage baseplate assembly protein gpV